MRTAAFVLGRELAITALLLAGVSLVVFAILFLAPGDPFSLLLEGQMGDDAVREALGVPTAWYAQYLSWVSNILRGNFGTSVHTGLPVLSEIIRVGINTLYLTLGALLITLVIAIPIALLSARMGNTSLTLPLTIAAYVISALPVFWLGYIAIYISTHRFGAFPIVVGSSGTQGLNMTAFLLPIVVLGVGNGTISEVVRYLREEMGRVFAEEYIRTAKAKGGSVWRHSVREGFIVPITQIIATKIPFVLGGAVVVEQVFNWPGMGRMAWQAAQTRDYPLIMGITIIAAVIVRMGSLLQRVVHFMVNPAAAGD